MEKKPIHIFHKSEIYWYTKKYLLKIINSGLPAISTRKMSIFWKPFLLKKNVQGGLNETIPVWDALAREEVGVTISYLEGIHF